MKSHLREQAVRLRLQGWSYNVIAERIDASKSTLSHWLKAVPYTPNEAIIRRIKEGPAKSAANRSKEKVENILRVKSSAIKELGSLSTRDLWMLGIGVYIGEGAKMNESIRVINSDPNVILMAISWLHFICKVPYKNFSIRLHIYPDINERAAMRYWSAITKVPVNQFSKIQIDRRTNKSGKKQKKLPYGTAHLLVKSCGDPKCGVILHRRIMGWIEGAYKQVQV